MKNESQKNSTRQLKVYRGHYSVHFRNAYKTYPVIRLGGIYLSALGFQIGDDIEVSVERGKIVITKAITTL